VKKKIYLTPGEQALFSALSSRQVIDTGSLQEVFGTGTAAVISPVGEIKHEEETIIINNKKIGELSQKLYDEITGIQYGEKDDKFNWCLPLSLPSI